VGFDAVVDTLAGDGRLAGLAAALLGGPVVCFGRTFVVKAGGGADPVLWHQDGHPWQARGIINAVTLWVPLDPTGPENGGLAVIPASHRLAAQPLRPGGRVPAGGGGPADGKGEGEAGAGGGGRGDVFGGGIDPELVDEGQAVFLEMAPGDVSAHHPRLIHGSGPNWTRSLRRSLVLRYGLEAEIVPGAGG
jgi:ectoine hydroxylase-related dioxygenase (phytanoyl-CoA dioxygenase family)